MSKFSTRKSNINLKEALLFDFGYGFAFGSVAGIGALFVYNTGNYMLIAPLALVFALFMTAIGALDKRGSSRNFWVKLILTAFL